MGMPCTVWIVSRNQLRALPAALSPINTERQQQSAHILDAIITLPVQATQLIALSILTNA